MPGKNSKQKSIASSRRFKKQKAQRRQQKLSVLTIKKIADERIASALQNHIETRYMEQQISVFPQSLLEASEYLPDGSVLTMQGCFDETNFLQQNANFWGPQTSYLEVQDDTTDYVPGDPGHRLGESIYLKGISFRGGFILPASCFEARVTMLVLRTKDPLVTYHDIQEVRPGPWGYFMNNEIPNSDSYTKVFEKSFKLKQNSGRNGVYSTSHHRKDLYVPINTRIGYEMRADLTDPLVANKADMLKGHYQVYFYSDRPAWEEGAAVNEALFPQVFGRIRWLYTDA